VIDTPLVRPVALLNLLGCQTLWCCCGFNYKGQPEDRSHSIGAVQICMLASPRVWEVAVKLLNSDDIFGSGQALWTLTVEKRGFQEPFASLAFHFPKKHPHPWMTEGSTHYHELPNLAIEYLVRGLYSLADEMAEEAVVQDTDAAIKDKVPHWDRPSREPWVIRKADFLPEIRATVTPAEGETMVAQAAE
jgi:hypothetical protein